jgi:Flp pilus assembly protein TadG
MPRSRGTVFAFPLTSCPRQRLRPFRALTAHTRSQSLVEFALTLPILFSMTVTLFQFGIIFLIYLAMIHSTRDVARWMVVHRDTVDSDVQAHIQGNMPTVLIPSSFNFTGLNSATSSNWPWNPKCASLDATTRRCETRQTGSPQEVALRYDAGNQIFLPTRWTFANWTFSIPTQIPTYRYTVIIEPR